jgi:hypothetical protein
MPFSERVALVMAKVESPYGQDAGPVVGTDAILTTIPEVAPQVDRRERNYARASYTPLARLTGTRHMQASFTCEVKGSGAAGTAPEIGPLLRACGMKQTINAGTSVVYTLVSLSADFKSVSMHIYKENLKHVMLGCMGSVRFEYNVGQEAMAHFTMQGLYATPTDAAIPDSGVVYDTTIPPLCLGTSLALDTFNPVATALEIDMANAVARRMDLAAATGVKGIIIPNRVPVGSLDPEVVAEGTHAFWGKFIAGTTMALTLTLGSAAGNTIAFSAPAVQYDSIGYASRDSILTYSTPFVLTGTDDDELTITFT